MIGQAHNSRDRWQLSLLYKLKIVLAVLLLGFVLLACTEPPSGENKAPVVATISNQTNAVQSSVNVSVSAVDADGDTLSYSASGLPPGINISSTTGAITGSATAEGAFTVTINVSDGKAITSTNFVWTIGDVDGDPGDGAQRISNAGVLTTQNLGVVKDEKTSEPKKETIPGVGNNPTATCTTTGWGKEEVRKLTNTVGLNLSGTTLYPGALIRGKNFKNGSFTPITIPRSGGTISMSGVKLAPNAVYKKDIDIISAANVQQAIEDILSTEVQGTAANASYQEETTYDYNHLTFELGIDARYGLASMEADLSIDKTKTKNYVFSKFTQVYYDVTYQDPELSTSVFRDGANFSDPEGQIGAENPPLYVSKVSYGRMVFFVAESEHESTEVEAALKAAVRGGVGSGKVESGLSYNEVMARTKVSYYVIGGDAGLALTPIAAATPAQMFQKVKEFIAGPPGYEDGENGRTAAVYSASSPGVPIAYTLNYLSDRTPARMSYSVNYDQKDCTFDYPETAQTRTFTPSSYTITPAHKSGDRELDCGLFCSSPSISASTRIAIVRSGTAIQQYLSMKAEENGATTEFSGSISRIVYTAPQGWKITGIVTPTSHSVSYRDDDHSNDIFTYTNGDFARRYVFVGDSSGTDRPKVTVSVHPITINLQRTN